MTKTGLILIILLIIIFVTISGCTTKKPVIEEKKDYKPDLNQSPKQSVHPPIQPGLPPVPLPTSEKIHSSADISPLQNNTNHSTMSDLDPYSIIPHPDPALNHTSILKNARPEKKEFLNSTFTGDIGLNGNAIGKNLNITAGPFSITYTIHPNISSPRDVWARITIYDPWQNLIAQGGYNRGYPGQETQTLTIYREGRFSLIIEGDFASIHYDIKTGEPVSVSTQIQTPVSNEKIPEEEIMMRKLRGP